MENEHKVLIVHNDRLILTLITDALTKAGYVTRQTTGGYSALSIIREFQPELVMISIDLPDLSVKETLSEMKGKRESVLKVILLTTKETRTGILAELGDLADDSIIWPASNRELLAKAQSNLQIRESHKELLKSKERYQTIFETVPISIWEEDFSELMQFLKSLKESGVNDLEKYMEDNPDFAEKAARLVKVKDVNQITLSMFHAKEKQEFLKPLDFFFSDSYKPFEEQLLALWNRSKFFEQELVHKTFNGGQVSVRMTIQYPDEPEQFSRVYVLKANITEQKKVEESLRESRNRYKAIFNNVPISIWEENFSWVVRKFEELRELGITDLRKYMDENAGFSKEVASHVLVKKVNPISLTMFHAKNKKEMLTSIDAYFSGSYETFEDQLIAIWNHARFYEVELFHKTLDGGKIFVRMSMQFPESPEQFSTVYVLKDDITAQKSSLEQQHFFYEVLSASVNEIYAFDAETLKFVFVSKGAIANLGYSIEEMREKTPVDIKPEFTREKFEVMLKSLSNGKQSMLEFKTLHQRADGTTYPVEVHLQKISLGGRAVFLAVIVDISDRVTKDMELAHSRDLLRYIIENSNNGIAILDLDMNYLYVSKRYLEDFKISEKDVVGKNHYKVFPDLPQKWRDFHKKALKGEVSSADEDCFVRANGSVEWTRWECRPWYESDGVIGGIVIYNEVITDQVASRRALEESEQKFRLIVDNADLGVGYYAPDGKLLYLNSIALKFMNGKLEDFVGKTLVQLYGDTVGFEYTRRVQLAAQSDISMHYEDQVPLPTGTRWFRSTYTRALDSKGNLIGVQIISDDITERKLADERLRSSEEQFREVFESANVGKSLTLPTGEVRANKALCEMLGYSTEELSQKTWQMITPPEDIETVNKILQPILAGKQPGARFTKRYICKDGSIKWGDVSTILRRDADGKPLHFITTIVDITDRKKAEESLQQTTQLLSLFIQNSPIYAFIKEVKPKESRVIFASENYIEMIGVPGSKMVGKTMGELFPADFAMKITADDWDVVSKGEILKLGEELNNRSYITIKFPINLGSKKLLAGYSVDVTDLKSTERRLQELFHRQEALLGAIPDILMETDLKKVYTWANPAGLEFFGPDVVGREAADYFLGKQDTYQVVDRLFKGDERTIYVESWQRRVDGEKRLLAWWCRVILNADGNPIGALSTARDITEKQLEEDQVRQLNAQLEQMVEERTRELREAQEQIVRKEKLAFLGQLAGSVGHELRNPLAVIANAVYFLKMTNPNRDEKVMKYLNMIESETQGAEKIISDLLEFARTKSIERTPSSIFEMVNHSLERLSVPSNINIDLDLPATLPKVLVDPRHIGQILENLVTNACQAMKEGGKVKISARIERHNDHEFIGVSVKDTGVGIPDENLEKLFEPLFTTKARGIGLGLAVCKKLADINEGYIEVKSKEGKGSEFILYLPVKGQVA